MPELPGTDLGLAHLRSMAERITPEFSEAKLGRWLGWAQCALVAAGVGVTLEDVKRINVGHAVESLPLDPEPYEFAGTSTRTHLKGAYGLIQNFDPRPGYEQRREFYEKGAE